MPLQDPLRGVNTLKKGGPFKESVMNVFFPIETEIITWFLY